MFDSVQDELIRLPSDPSLDEIAVNPLSDRELVIRPRADDCCTVAMWICEDTVCNKVEIGPAETASIGLTGCSKWRCPST
jgi:hypothetical protein